MLRILKRVIHKIVRRRPSMNSVPLTYVQELVKQGLSVGKDFHMGPEVIIDDAHCWHISIGNSVTLAPRVHILAHDASTKMFLGLTRIGNVAIGNNVFIGAGSIILPGVVIGSRVVIGAGSVVSRNVPDNSVAAGNPARVICGIDDFLDRRRRQLQGLPVFDARFTVPSGVTDAMKAEMNEKMKGGFAYID
jgi:maltose O-acetyltransferase